MTQLSNNCRLILHSQREGLPEQGGFCHMSKMMCHMSLSPDTLDRTTTLKPTFGFLFEVWLSGAQAATATTRASACRSQAMTWPPPRDHGSAESLPRIYKWSCFVEVAAASARAWEGGQAIMLGVNGGRMEMCRCSEVASGGGGRAHARFSGDFVAECPHDQRT